MIPSHLGSIFGKRRRAWNKKILEKTNLGKDFFREYRKVSHTNKGKYILKD